MRSTDPEENTENNTKFLFVTYDNLDDTLHTGCLSIYFKVTQYWFKS